MEIKNFFPDLEPKYFLNAPGRISSSLDRAKTLGGNIIDLLKWLASLPDDPTVALQPVLTSHNTWAHRSLYFSKASRNQRVNDIKKAIKKASAGKDNLLDESHSAELTEEELSLLHSFCPGVFDRVICDEAQKFKTINTQTHLSISASGAKTLNLLTATPMINRPVDLRGVLWKPAFDSVPLPDKSNQNTLTESSCKYSKEVFYDFVFASD